MFVALLAILLFCVILVSALVLTLYIFVYHNLSTSDRVPIHIQFKNLTTVYLHFSPPGLCTVVTIYFASTYVINPTTNYFFFKP